jgi:ankyrin repeat protein
MMASERGQSEVVDYLIGNNADVNITDNVCFHHIVTLYCDGTK